MKQRLSVVLLLLFIGIQSIAQIPKGTMRVGPSVSYSRVNQNTPAFAGFGASTELTITEVSTALAIGGFVADNIALNVQFEYGLESSKIGSNNLVREAGFFIGPSLLFMVPLNENLYLPIEGVVGFASQRSRRTDTDGDLGEPSLADGLAWGGSVGLEYLVARRIGVRLSLVYSQANLKTGSDSEQKSDGFLGGIGVNFYFNKGE